ncbi:hypothetical protein ACFLYQ_06545 [Chloroflexota bacterium]
MKIAMIVECSQCGERKYFPEPVPYGKKYLCKKCRTVLILAEKNKTPAVVNRNRMTIAVHQALIILVSALLLLNAMGSSVAAAKNASRPETPLEGIIAVLSGVPVDSLNLLENVQDVAAQYERSIVSESLQIMRILERIRDVPPVTQPTNNMAQFPTSQNPLFPEYLSWKYSQFGYTVDKYGIINTGTANSSSVVYY